MGANINLLDSKGETALFYGTLNAIFLRLIHKISIILFSIAASGYESNDTLNVLINAGLNVNHQNIDGKTALMSGTIIKHIRNMIV